MLDVLFRRSRFLARKFAREGPNIWLTCRQSGSHPHGLANGVMSSGVEASVDFLAAHK
jgi:hypothetical protein